jgi:uncharacterized protein
MKYIILFITLLVTNISLADPVNFLIAADSSSGTYKEMTEQIASVCGDETHQIQVVPNKGGALQNLEQLINNKVNAAFIHSDIIYAKSLTDGNFRKYKTLVNLYPEEIHVLALRNALEKTGGVYGIGAKSIEYTSLSDLEGLKVGAAGGSYISANILSDAGKGGFEVVKYNDGAEAIVGLKDGEVQAVIFIGGAPLTSLSNLKSSEFKLLPLGDKILNKVTGEKGIYKPAIITYNNLDSDMIKTVSTPAIILTRSYTTPKFVEPQKWFRNCFYEKLTELQETPGTHKKWQEIDPSDKGVWEWYDFSNSSSTDAKPAVE